MCQCRPDACVLERDTDAVNQIAQKARLRRLRGHMSDVQKEQCQQARRAEDPQILDEPKAQGGGQEQRLYHDGGAAHTRPVGQDAERGARELVLWPD